MMVNEIFEKFIKAYKGCDIFSKNGWFFTKRKKGGYFKADTLKGIEQLIRDDR